MQRKLRGIFLMVAVLFVSSGLWAEDNPFIGTWKFIPEKSKPGDRSALIKLVPYGADGLKMTRDIIEAPGNAAFWEWSANFDGKDYPFLGNPNYDTITLKKIDAYTFGATRKKEGKERNTAWYNLTKDGKTMGVATTGVNPQGNPVVFYSVYERQ